MDAGFSDNQRELCASVRSVLLAECPPTVVREAYEDPDRWRQLWKTASALGWTALADGTADDGLGIVELIGALEELGAACAPIPFLSSVGLAAGVLQAAGETLSEPLARISQGAVAALVVASTSGRLPGAAGDWNGSRLTARVGAVADASRAELLVVIAAAADGATLAAVITPGPGVELSPQDCLDPTRPLASLVIDVAPDGLAPIDLDVALALPLTASAADLVGLASRILEVSVTHALQRTQFGRPIGAFQAVKHRLADCYVAIERARGLTYLAAMTLADEDCTPAQRWRAAALAKAAAGDAVSGAARAGVQIHGAIAQTWEHDMHLYVRRAWQSAAQLGDSRALYREVARREVSG